MRTGTAFGYRHTAVHVDASRRVHEDLTAIGQYKTEGWCFLRVENSEAVDVEMVRTCGARERASRSSRFAKFPG